MSEYKQFDNPNFLHSTWYKASGYAFGIRCIGIRLGDELLAFHLSDLVTEQMQKLQGQGRWKPENVLPYLIRALSLLCLEIQFFSGGPWDDVFSYSHYNLPPRSRSASLEASGRMNDSKFNSLLLSYCICSMDGDVWLPMTRGFLFTIVLLMVFEYQVRPHG